MNNEELTNIMELAESFSNGKKLMGARLPYHLNVIDELYINENGHSRILAKLLQYKSENQHYEMLESLVSFVTKNLKKENYGNIKVVNPEVTQEKERIDLWVREKGHYAIIFENKIYNAADQDAQLNRYINRTKEYGFREDQIFVVYLSQNGVEPDNQSWGGYKEAFQHRYVNLSFRNHILPWLKEQVLPDVRIKETVLRSAIEQYIDYLEGLFDLRIQNNAIKMETEKMIVEKLNLDQIGSGLKKVKFLQHKIEEANELSNQLMNLKDKIRNEVLEEYKEKWNKEIVQKYPKLESCRANCHVGVIVDFSGEKFNVCIFEDSRLYCQIDKDGFEKKELQSSLMDYVKPLLNQHSKNNCVWKYYDINDFDGVFKCFNDVMDLLLKG